MSNKLGVYLLSVALAGLVFSPCMAFAADAVTASEKTETVNVETNASGTVEKVEVETTLKNDSSAGELLDSTELTDIKGEDDASYTSSGDSVIWKADGKDVTYTGKWSDSLPITMKVTYRLNGTEVSPAEIVGKSGDVSIRYEFTNESTLSTVVNGVQADMYIPFTCITALMLDGENFSDVEVENGKIVDDGSDAIVAGYAMPGLKKSLGDLANDSKIPDFFEVKAKAKDFELKSTMTIVSAGLMADMDVDEFGFGDLDDVSSGLSDGISQLISGADELTSGMSKLADGASKLDDGAGKLATGAETLSGGLYQLTYGQDGKSGLQGAAESSKTLVDGLGKVNDSLSTIADKKKGLPAVADGLAAISQAYPDAKSAKALEKAVAASEDLDEKTKAALTGLIESTAQVSELSAGLSKYSDGIGELSTSYSTIVKQAKSLPDGLAKAAAAAKKLYGGSTSLSDGASELSSATAQLSDGVKGAADGSGELAKGLVEYDKQGISKVVDSIDNDLGGLKKRLRVLSDAADAYDNFAGKQEGTSSSVKFVYETAAVEAD